MKRWTKVAIVLALALVVVIGGLMVAVKILLTPERIRAIVIPEAEKALQRKVSLGDIGISLFTGVRVEDFRIRTKADDADFVATDALVLSYRLWPLFSGQVAIDEIRLDRPRIRIERLADGRFNFSDLLDKPATPSTPAAPVQKTDESPVLPDIRLAKAVVRQGEVTFIDHKVSLKEPFTLQVQALDLQVRDLRRDRAFPVELSCAVNGAPVELSVTVDPAARGGEGSLSLKGVDVAAFAPYFATALPGELKGLTIASDIHFAGNADQLHSQGMVQLADLDLRLEALPDAPLSKLPVQLDYVLTLNLAKDALTLESARLAVGSLLLEAQGAVNALRSAPVAALDVTVPPTDLSRLVASLPPGMTASVRPLAPKGQLQANARIEGPVSQPLKLLRTGKVLLSEVQVAVAGYTPQVDGEIQLKGLAASSPGLALDMAGQKAQLAFETAALNAQPLKATFAVTADNLNLTALKAAGPAAEAKTSAKGGAADGKARQAGDIGPYDLPLDLAGTIRVAKAVYNKMELANLKADVTLKNNLLIVDPIAAEVGGGHIAGRSQVNLGVKGLAYSSNIRVEQVAVDQVIAGFWPKVAGTVLGRLSLNAKADGRGTDPAVLRKNLQGEGQLQLFKGVLQSEALGQGLVDLTRVEELRVLKFNQVDLGFLLDKGKVGFKGFADGVDTKVSPKGQVGLDGSLDMNLGMNLSPELTQKLVGSNKIGRVFTDKAGWSTLPLKLTGSVSQPTVALDEAAMQALLQKKVEEKVQKTLEEKLLKKLAPSEPKESAEPQEEQPAPSTPSKDMLEEGLKKLFKR